MSLPITGRCFCGAVRFELSAPPVATRTCWCRDCQYLAAGNATVNLVFPSASLSFSGAVTTYQATAASGNTMRRRFCPTCGTPLFSQAVETPDYLVVRAGALNDPSIGRPAIAIWTESAPVWACIDPTIPTSPRQPQPLNPPPSA